MRYLFLLLSLMGFTLPVHATILPPNNLDKEDNLLKQANMTEAEFLSRVDEVVSLWRPFAQAHGARLAASSDWADSTVNAYASRTGNSWNLNFFGGLARRPEVTPDAFSLVVCHELGHHFGGYYFFGGTDNMAKMAIEGTADYFATQACAQYLWKNQIDINRTFRDTADDTTRQECNTAWGTEAEQNLCYRISQAGAALAHLFAVLEHTTTAPSAATPDHTQVTSTITYHPPAQCRMDTYFQGALCTRAFNLNLIPGSQFTYDLNGVSAELDANKYSCSAYESFQRGFRPRCWFKPQVH